MPNTTDFELLGSLAAAAQRGDRHACEAFLGHLYDYVHRVLSAKLGAFADHDDLTQECLLGMHKSLSTYRCSRNIKPWVHAIIRYKVADHFRALGRRREAEFKDGVVDPAATLSAGDGQTDGVSPAMDIRAMVDNLPEPLGRAVILTKFDGLSTEDAARLESVSAAALRKRLSRAYSRLAKAITREKEIANDGW
jgi:RNA polymerase sigma-70 factor (ECF subfamily)